MTSSYTTPRGATGEPQLIRMVHRKAGPAAEAVSFADLETELATVRVAYEAIQSVGRALDDANPTVLAGTNQVLKAFLLGRT